MANKSEHSFTDSIVRIFLGSNLSLVLILLSVALGLAALWLTPREEDPQIVVPMADVYVSFPGHGAKEVEHLVSTPLEKILYQIDGVEYVYSISREGQAIITVRYYVGEDRERSLVKLYKKIDENIDIVPPGLSGWVVKPVEIDDVPIVTLTLRSQSSDSMALRRVAEELAQRLAETKDVSRAYVTGGLPRIIQIYMDTDRMAAYHVSPLELKRAIEGANLRVTAGDFRKMDKLVSVDAGAPFTDARQLRELVVGVADGHPVFLKDVAKVEDGPAELDNYVRLGWGPAKNFAKHEGFPGTHLGKTGIPSGDSSAPAVTIAIAKKKGANAVLLAKDVLREAARLKDSVVPLDMELIVTRNNGLTADDKVNELVWGIAAALVIIVILLGFGLGWREALIVALAVPVVFGLTLALDLALGFTINRVTLFALILSLGLLVDDPIVDVENISRHFSLRKKASRRIVVDAVSEIRPPLIVATLAVVASFLPMFFITGMMGPYMRPMAFNVPVAMFMSMFVAFTITPWLSYHFLKRKFAGPGIEQDIHGAAHELGDIRASTFYKIFNPLLSPLLKSKSKAWAFLGVIGVLTLGAIGLAAMRVVPLKMLPFDNKNELLIVLDFDKGTSLERTDAAVRDFERYLAQVPELVDYVSYVGLASPMDFNGMVRHYYLRKGDNLAELRLNLADKKNRTMQSHAIALRMRNELQTIADRHHAKMKIVETPPGPPVLASVVAEVYGNPDSSYEEILAASDSVKARLSVEPGVADLDDVRDAPQKKLLFVPDKEKAALNGISSEAIALTLKAALAGTEAGLIWNSTERNPLRIELRLPVEQRSRAADLAKLHVKGDAGQLVPLAEIGHWEESRADQQIYHKNLKRVAYVFAETVGRPPSDVVVDLQSDKNLGTSYVNPRPVGARSFLRPGGGVAWTVPDQLKVEFAGEGEWKITLDVFRDLGIAFGAAMLVIYILLVAQMGSFILPIVVMMAIPLTVLGVMPGFWALNALGAEIVGSYLNPIYFTATAMIGMIALAGIVTRNSIILIDFTHLLLAQGRPLNEALVESCAVRLRPIMLTATTAMFGAIPIIMDPIFSGLAWSLIFGLFASTLFTLFVIPTSYWLIYANRPGHGLPAQSFETETDSDTQ
ncbi:MAG: acriflavine resistance protein B [Lentisphaerae bacterium GWF2_52_8]|nr:MAG: acriflavine resistance protein B [Lentisphaerae bacterium GWF2_52_8]